MGDVADQRFVDRRGGLESPAGPGGVLTGNAVQDAGFPETGQIPVELGQIRFKSGHGQVSDIYGAR
jgi:hypothetical protein